MENKREKEREKMCSSFPPKLNEMLLLQNLKIKNSTTTMQFSHIKLDFVRKQLKISLIGPDLNFLLEAK